MPVGRDGACVHASTGHRDGQQGDGLDMPVITLEEDEGRDWLGEGLGDN